LVEVVTGSATPRALTKLENNASMMGVSGNIYVRLAYSGEKLTIPHAADIARAVAVNFPHETLKATSVTEILVVDHFDDLGTLAESPSGFVYRQRGKNIVIDTDTQAEFRRIYLLREAAGENLEMGASLDRMAFVAPGTAKPIRVKIQAPDRALAPLIKKDSSVFTGGLISLSAEPPEGFFAAATAAELEQRGHVITNAEKADIWIYRVPDSRGDSYFKFNFSAADRPHDIPYASKFKIATGIGPASDPISLGGREADLLWLGDEQHGAIDAYLRTISKPDLTVRDLQAHAGFIQRLSDQEVLLGRPDKAHGLTNDGFNQLHTDPARYRRVYSEEYDQYLRSLFQDQGPPPAKASYLLATSRGCTQGCAICCSGGLKSFQSFTGPRMMEEIEKLAVHGKLEKGEAIDVFLLDSNLNNNPKRLIEFADLYEKSPYHGQFRFYVRHNTVNGFLLPEVEGVKAVNHALIDAYHRLGIDEVFMGIDTFDDASTLTLKTNRIKVAKSGIAARPTYTSQEVRTLIDAFDKKGMQSKGFFLTNNPWVTDMDRIDAYYNIADLWFKNSRFSIDARNRNVLRLKPFEGSPIQRATQVLHLNVVDRGRFTAFGRLARSMK